MKKMLVLLLALCLLASCASKSVVPDQPVVIEKPVVQDTKPAEVVPLTANLNTGLSVETPAKDAGLVARVKLADGRILDIKQGEGLSDEARVALFRNALEADPSVESQVLATLPDDSLLELLNEATAAMPTEPTK